MAGTSKRYKEGDWIKWRVGRGKMRVDYLAELTDISDKKYVLGRINGHLTVIPVKQIVEARRKSL